MASRGSSTPGGVLDDSLQRYTQQPAAPDPRKWKRCTGLHLIAEPEAQQMPLMRSPQRPSRTPPAGIRRSTYAHGTSPGEYSSTAAGLP